MSKFEELVERVARLGRVNPPKRAERWLRAATSLLVDWGGDDARDAARDHLPDELFAGRGSSGESWKDASARVGEGREDCGVYEEAARRAKEPDPAKVAYVLRMTWGVLKEELGPDAAARVGRCLPDAVRAEWDEASTLPPWRYRLLPQSYRRPERIRIGHHH